MNYISEFILNNGANIIFSVNKNPLKCQVQLGIKKIKAFSVVGTYAVFHYSLPVEGCRIPLVSGPSVLWVIIVYLLHKFIPESLGKD